MGIETFTKGVWNAQFAKLRTRVNSQIRLTNICRKAAKLAGLVIVYKSFQNPCAEILLQETYVSSLL